MNTPSAMLTPLFGTDGLRGRAGSFPLTPAFLVRLGQGIGLYLKSQHPCPQVIMGQDTRSSGHLLASALQTGLFSTGVHVLHVGILPTPAIGYLTRNFGADLGLMISASHNPFYDNGIKIFNAQGEKLSPAEQALIVKTLNADIPSVPDEKWGQLHVKPHGAQAYKIFLKQKFPQGLEGMRLVVDCAHGANFQIAPQLLKEQGATVIALGSAPDGYNINAHQGALYPEKIQKAVIAHQADLGIAFDGDGDRLILVDDQGTVRNGDDILALFAQSWRTAGQLSSNVVVGTVMSNGGLERFLKDNGLLFIRTDVGDRAVGLCMAKHNSNLGGEPSGHILLPDYHTTGDALLAALEVLKILDNCRFPAHQVLNLFQKRPQIIRNLEVPNRKIENQKNIDESLPALSKRLGKDERLVIRQSGTQNCVRILLEGSEIEPLKKHMKSIVQDLKHYLAL